MKKDKTKSARFTTMAAAGVAAVGVFAVSVPAFASNINTNTWYAGTFTSTGTPVNGGGSATNGPILPLGTFANAVSAPAGTSWTVTLSGAGYLTVTDVEASGDYFTVYDNGNPMALATGALGGQSGVISGGLSYTSTPTSGSYVGSDISAALASAAFSSGTFALLPGVNAISMTFDGSIGYGDMAFIAEGASVPEPGSLAMFGLGLTMVGGLGAFLKRRRRSGQ